MNPDKIALLKPSELIVGNSYLAIFGEALYDSSIPEVAREQDYIYEKDLKFIFLGMENDNCIHKTMQLTILKVFAKGKIKFIFIQSFFKNNLRFHKL